MTEITSTYQGKSAEAFDFKVSTSSSKTVSGEQSQSKESKSIQNIAFEKNAMLLIVLSTLAVFAVLIAFTLMNHNYFAVKLLAVELVLIAIVAVIVRRMH